MIVRCFLGQKQPDFSLKNLVLQIDVDAFASALYID
jgi:hypothetical protein